MVRAGQNRATREEPKHKTSRTWLDIVSLALAKTCNFKPNLSSHAVAKHGYHCFFSEPALHPLCTDADNLNIVSVCSKRFCFTSFTWLLDMPDITHLM